MSEKDMRETYATLLEADGAFRMAKAVRDEDTLGIGRDQDIALQAMERWGQEVERRTIERCAKVDEEAGWLIWSNEHRAWWRPDECGYTVYLEAAGRYTRDKALSICRTARGGWLPGKPPSEMPVRECDAILALQDAPSDDTPPARKAELWSET